MTQKTPDKSGDQIPSSMFQNAAIQAATGLFRESEIKTLDELTEPVIGTLPSGEEIVVRRSDWVMYEEDPIFPDYFAARRAVSSAIYSGYLLLTSEQKQGAEIQIAAERVTDIRYMAEDGEYRVRIYSTLLPPLSLDMEAAELEGDVFRALSSMDGQSLLDMSPSSGFIVSLQKISHTEEGGSGSEDSTATFMALSNSLDDVDLRLASVEDLIGAITGRIKRDVKVEPYRIVSKVRVGAHLRVETGDPVHKNDEFVFAAYDTRVREYVTDEFISGEKINALEIWEDVTPNTPESPVSSEVEVNVKSNVFTGNEQLANRPGVAAGVILSFTEKGLS